jgi:ribosomal protein S18 acetylase RimI-like enzyme
MCFNWNYGLITELFVREEYRNIGIGTSLINFAEQELTAMGFKKIFLWVGKSNENAQRLYASLGFTDTNSDFLMKEFL